MIFGNMILLMILGCKKLVYYGVKMVHQAFQLEIKVTSSLVIIHRGQRKIFWNGINHLIPGRLKQIFQDKQEIAQLDFQLEIRDMPERAMLAMIFGNGFKRISWYRILRSNII